MSIVFRTISILLLTVMTVPIMTQSKQQKEASNAKVVVTNGRERLVLKNQIQLNMNSETWRFLDSLINSPSRGKGVQLKDVKGYNVLVQKGRINNEIGLIFTWGTRIVAITEDEFVVLRNSSSGK